jgi:hypothetical protein
LTALGHADAFRYTPRQAHAFLFIARRRQGRDDKRLLRLHAMVAQGDVAQINKELKADD